MAAFRSNGQNLFTYVSDLSSGFSTGELDKIDSLRNISAYDSVMIVQVGDLWNLQDSGNLNVNLPGETNVTAKLFDVKLTNIDTPEARYVWNGHYIGQNLDEDSVLVNDHGGEVTIIKSGGEVYGDLVPFFNNVQYKLISLGIGRNALARYDMSKASTGVCDPITSTTLATASTVTTPCDPVKVLFLYTPNSRQVTSNIDHEIDLAMADLDGATYNSFGPLNIYCKFALAGKVEIPSNEYNPGSTIQNDLNSLQSNTYVSYYRDLYKADIVVCLVNRDYGDYYGLTRAVGPSSSDAFIIIRAPYLNFMYTLSHEIGHAMGCRHQQSSIYTNGNTNSYDNSSDIAHGYRFNTGKLWWEESHREIMHVYSGIKEHFFAFPGLMAHGKPFGSVNNNTWPAFFYNSCTVAGFETGDASPFRVYITRTGTPLTSNTINLSGWPVSGYAGYDFHWSISYDGGSNWSSLGNNYTVAVGSASFTMPNIAYVVVKLEGVDLVNQHATAFYTVINQAGNWNDPVHSTDAAHLKSTESIVTNGLYRAELHVDPNPAKDNAIITINMPGFSNADHPACFITDVLGREVARKEIRNANEVWELDARNMNSGYYFIELKGAGAIKTQKLVVNK